MLARGFCRIVGLGRRWLAGGVLAGAMLAALGVASPAHAALDQTWIAAEGSDAASCQAYDPCLTLAKALANTTAGGTVFVMDEGVYGSATITQSVSIRGEVGRPVMVAQIRINAGPADRVVIADVDLEGVAQSRAIAYAYGVRVDAALEVLIQNCGIRNYQAGDATAVIITSAYQVRVTIDHSTLYNNQVGVLVTNNPGSGHLKLFHSLLMANYTSGVRVLNTGNDVIMAYNNILGSTKGLDLQNGGVGKSYGNNLLTSGDAPTVITMN
jgi:hypothetical protein